MMSKALRVKTKRCLVIVLLPRCLQNGVLPFGILPDHQQKTDCLLRDNPQCRFPLQRISRPCHEPESP